jgi:hypothetical protein
MEFLLLWYFCVGSIIAFLALRTDKIQKGFKPDAKDGDNDGLVQDGTKWERKAKK